MGILKKKQILVSRCMAVLSAISLSMNLRDGLGVNTSKKIRTNSKTKKKRLEKRKERFLKQNSQHLANQLSHPMLDFKACYAIIFHFSNCLVRASGYIVFNVQIKQI